MNIIAIDPGASGGIAWHAWDRSGTQAMPQTEKDIAQYIHGASETGFTVAYVEKVGGYAGGRGAPGSAMFNFGKNVGVIYGALYAYNFRIIEVTPQKWQKHFSLGTAAACTSKTEWKNKLKAEAQRRFPSLEVTLKTADALLILDYALAMERGKE